MLLYMSNGTQNAKSTPLHSVSVAGIVVDDGGRVLAIQRADNGTWEPPGGVLELDERPEDGLMREVLEETGLHVAVERLTGVYKNMTRGVLALVFQCRPMSGALQTSSESTAVEWLTPEETKNRMADVYAVRVLDGLAAESKATVRSHDGSRFI